MAFWANLVAYTSVENMGSESGRNHVSKVALLPDDNAIGGSRLRTYVVVEEIECLVRSSEQEVKPLIKTERN